MADIIDFDMKTPSRPGGGGTAAPTEKLVLVGEETIQVAPHPTTNRYPWPSVDNPKVPVYQATPLPPIPAPTPVAPPTAPEPVPDPVPESKPEPQPDPVPTPLPPIAPPVASLPVAASLVIEPPAPPAEPAEVTIREPINQPEGPAEALSDEPADDSSDEPEKPEMAEVKYDENGQPIFVYSDYTKEAWSVFRPNRLIMLLAVGLVLLAIGCVVVFWKMSGSPTSIMDVPFLQSIIHAV